MPRVILLMLLQQTKGQTVIWYYSYTDHSMVHSFMILDDMWLYTQGSYSKKSVITMNTSITTTNLYDILNPINGPRFLGIGTRCKEGAMFSFYS